MFRYLKAAFWASPQIAGLGRLPANAIALAGFGILGIGHPGFWLLGLGLETAYLFGLTTNRRFQKTVDAEHLHLTETDTAEQRRSLVAKLSASDRARLTALEVKCARILQLHDESQTDDFVIDGNREALQKLGWLYLKLLIARANLESLDGDQSESELIRKIGSLEQDLSDAKISPSLLESKQATLRILVQRRENLDRREHTLEEIESDLTRIEAQIDLALDHAGMRGKGGAISVNIDLVSRLLDDPVYGDSGPSIAEIGRRYESE